MIRAHRDLLARLLVIRKKREVSMNDFLRYSLGPVAWSLFNPFGNVYKSTKSDLLTCFEKKPNLVNQIPADAARVYDNMCIIRQSPTGFDNFRLHPIAQLLFCSLLINTGKRQLSLMSTPSRAEVDP